MTPPSETAAAPAVTEHLARFLRETQYGNVPEGVRDLAKAHILDALGLSLAGATTTGSSIINDRIAALNCDGQSHIFGTDLVTAPQFAALANGSAIHAHDYDDTCPQHLADRNGGLHATGPVMSAALAVAEPSGLSGRAVLEAFHVGVEVACRINHAVNDRHCASGYHPSGTVNVFGTAAAASRLLGASHETMLTALGLAASHSGGVRENFGTMTKPYHSGHAAEGGVISSELAARGFTAAQDVLEAPRGFFAVGGGSFDPVQVIDRLGGPWAFEDPGIWIKPHPSGALNHAAMTLLRTWLREGRVAADQVKAVRLRTNSNVVNTLLHNRPKTWLEAKFSLPFNAAAILVRGRAGLAEFTDAVVQDPEIQAMIDKIDYRAFDTIKEGYTNTTTLIEIDLTDGSTVSGQVDYPKGSPQDPMSYEEVTEKFEECAEFAKWPQEKAAQIVALVRDFEAMDDVRALTAALSARG